MFPDLRSFPYEIALAFFFLLMHRHSFFFCPLLLCTRLIRVLNLQKCSASKVPLFDAQRFLPLRLAESPFRRTDDARNHLCKVGIVFFIGNTLSFL